MKYDVELAMTRGAFALDVRFRCETDALAVVGPSGAGKSTLLDGLAGVECTGRVVLDGVDDSGKPLHRRRMGYVTQDALLFPHLSVRDNLLYSPHARVECEPASVLDDLVDALDLGGLLERMPRHLSGGEQRRVALARALMSRPRLLLLDEPFAGLDERRRRDALSLLRALRRRVAVPLVLVSHSASEVVGLADWALRLDRGRVVAEGPAPSLLRAGETEVDNHFVGHVVGPGRVRSGATELSVPLPPDARGEVRLACYAHDVLLARRRPEATSARNVVATTVERLTPAGDAVLVSLSAPPVSATLTPQAVAELELGPGSDVWALLKATAIAYLGAA